MVQNVEKERGENGWKPTRGVVMKIEFDRYILGELHKLMERKGVNSIYQMIRNACYSYVNAEKQVDESENGGGDGGGLCKGLLGIFSKRGTDQRENRK